MFDTVALAEQNQKAARCDVRVAADDELCDAVRALAVARAGLDAAEAHVLAELDVRGVCDHEFGSPTLWWVTAQTHAPRTVVKSRLGTGLRLRTHLDEVDEALMDGRVTVDHARVLADAAGNPRVGDHVRELQGTLIDLAQQVSFQDWRSHVAQVVELLDQDGGFDPDRERARNFLRTHWLSPGHLALAGELIGDQALSFKTLLDAETDRQRQSAGRDHDESAELPLPDRNTLQALALVELSRKGAAGSVPAGRGPVCDVSLFVHAQTPDRASTIDGEPLWSDVTRHLCCDAVVTPFTIGEDGTILEAGREQRLANRAQRRALARRDGGCVFPGCDIPVGWCDAHHVTPWEAGGSTDMANLALLCRRHHGVTHRLGWTMTALDDQTFVWTTPGGRMLTSQRHRGRPPDG